MNDRRAGCFHAATRATVFRRQILPHRFKSRKYFDVTWSRDNSFEYIYIRPETYQMAICVRSYLRS